MLLIKSIPTVTLKVCLGHASQPMEMLNCYMTYEKRTLWIHLKFVRLQNSQQYLPLFGNYLHFSYTTIKQNEGGRLAALWSRWPRPAPALEALAGTGQPPAPWALPAPPATGLSHQFLLFIFFLRHCSSDFRKPSHKNPSEQ